MSKRFLCSLRVLMMCGCAVAWANGATAQTPSPETAFPFVMPWDDATKNAADASWLNAPLTAERRITAKNGHFYDQKNRRVKLFGSNLTADGCFPAKEIAPQIAARMRKMGMNVMRLHHMDAEWPERNIFGLRAQREANYRAGNSGLLAPESLDRLDYFAAQMQQQGIYLNVNLHVSRALKATDGFPETEKLPDVGKVLAYFEPKFFEMQKQYARDLLTHFNPYTKMRWADSPQLATVELNNEDTIFEAARQGQLQNLPAFYREPLRRRWTNFLKARYGQLASLRAAWNREAATEQPNILDNGRFENGFDKWVLVNTKGRMSTQVEAISPAANAPTGTVPSGKAARIKVEEVAPNSWELQMVQTGLAVSEGETYTLEFQARADRPKTISVGADLDSSPWSSIGASLSAQVGSQWKKYRVVFAANGTRPRGNRVAFSFGTQVGDLWIADVSLRRGASLDVSTQQSLEKAADISDLPLVALDPTASGKDFTAFLMQVEREYAQGMSRFLRDELKVKAPIICSQADYGGVAGLARESALDFIDMHAYWQHPHFPGTSWDPANWLIPNTPMTRDAGGGTFPHLLKYRVANKPFTISEYNHAAPNEYSAETLPMLAAFAAQHDLDGLYYFDYPSGESGWQSDRITGFFAIGTNPNKMALSAASAIVFRQEQGAKPLPALTLQLPAERLDALTTTFNNLDNLWQNIGLQPDDWKKYRLQTQLVKGLEAPRLVRPQSAEIAPLLTWNAAQQGAATFLFNGTRAQVLLGLPENSAMRTANITVSRVLAPRGFAAFALAAQNGATIQNARTLLLTAVSNFENKNMQWNAERTSVGNQWGDGPVSTQGVAAHVELKLSGAARVYALDARGARKAEIPVTKTSTGIAFQVSPAHQTAWYEIAKNAR